MSKRGLSHNPGDEGDILEKSVKNKKDHNNNVSPDLPLVSTPVTSVTSSTVSPLTSVTTVTSRSRDLSKNGSNSRNLASAEKSAAKKKPGAVLSKSNTTRKGPSAAEGRSPHNPLASTESNDAVNYEAITKSIQSSMLQGFDIMSTKMADMMGKNLNQMQESLAYNYDQRSLDNSVPDHQISEEEVEDDQVSDSRQRLEASFDDDNLEVDTSFLQKRMEARKNKKEKAGFPVSENMAQYLTSCFESPLTMEEFKEKSDQFTRPKNVEWLQSPSVEMMVWRQLPPASKSYDYLVQKTQNVVYQSMTGMARSMELILKREVNAGLAVLSDTIEHTAYNSHVIINEDRKEKIKSILPGQFKMLSGSEEAFQETTPTSLLGDVKEGVSRATEAMKIQGQIFRAKKEKALKKKQNTVQIQHFGKPQYKSGYNNSSQGYKPHSKGGFKPQPGKGRGKNQPGFGKPNQNRAGMVSSYLPEWEKLTSDLFILQCVKGVKIPFIQIPCQSLEPNQYVFDKDRAFAIQNEIDRLLAREAICQVTHTEGCFISNIFTVPKPDGSHRVIIDLSRLNEFIKKETFKMDSLEMARDMMRPNAWLASIDLKDAYHSLAMDKEAQRFLVFKWNGLYFKFLVLPFGLTIAPRVFTKVLKPVFCSLREQGFSAVAYLDDSFLIEKTQEKCKESVDVLTNSFHRLGFVVNQDKSVLNPVQEIRFLGYILNSLSMTIRPTPCKREKALRMIVDLTQDQKFFPIEVGASLIGLLNDLCKGVEYGLAHVKHIEMDKIKALKCAGFLQWKALMSFSQDSLTDLAWWKENVIWRSKKIRITPPKEVLACDASDLGYGAHFTFFEKGTKKELRFNSEWSVDESDTSINFRELNAIYLSLLSIRDKINTNELMVYSDNMTAVTHVKKMGSVRAGPANIIAKRIWSFCEQRDLFLWITHLPGSENVIADEESRCFSEDTEWMLNKALFDWACSRWGVPEIDLFASRRNNQLDRYVAWLPDPFAMHIDAFTLDWGEFNFVYLFPPFRLIARCLQKLQQERVRAILVVPAWWGQIWSAEAHSLAKDMICVKKRKGNLIPDCSVIKKDYAQIENCPLWLILC